MTAIRQYVVVEKTPGYLPDDDDPFRTLILEDAKTALRDAVERYADHLADVYAVDGPRESTKGHDAPFVLSWSDDELSCFVTEPEREHDLGRVFEIIEDEDDAEFYSIDGHEGIGWHVLGYVEEPDEDTEWSGMLVEDRSRVVAVMVGDDARWTFDIVDVTPHYDEPLCGCGQIGCGWHGAD